MNLVENSKRAYLGISALMMVLGIILLLDKGIAIETLSLIFGVILLALGVIKLFGFFSKDLFRLAFQFDLALGVFSIIAGILLFTHRQQTMLLPLLMGIYITIDGVFKIQTAIDAKEFGMKCWRSIIAFAIVTAIMGIILLAMTDGGRTFVRILAYALIVLGVENFWVVHFTVEPRAEKNKRL